jgi:hypothetical protein
MLRIFSVPDGTRIVLFVTAACEEKRLKSAALGHWFVNRKWMTTYNVTLKYVWIMQSGLFSGLHTV